MISLYKVYYLFFVLGWFFFPFNDFKGFSFLGEFKNEAGSYFFLVGFFILILEFFINGKISIPYKSKIFQILIIFFIWCIITILLNIVQVNNSFFKHTTGFSRFMRQFISLFISAFAFLIFFWNVIKNWTSSEILFKTRKVFLVCFLFVFTYGILETLIVFFKIGSLRPVLALFDYFPFLDVNYGNNQRISSVTYEAPSLGNYLITTSGWMFSFIFTEKNKYRFLPTFMVVFLAFFSGSRTALINITLQLLILILVLYSMKEYRKLLKQFFRGIVVFSTFLLIINGPSIVREFEKKIQSLDFAKNLKKDLSNKSRFGMQYASIQVFLEHPIVGVGFGQETYYKRFHYPEWATRDNYEFKYIYQNTSIKSFPTAYNLFTRLLAETGIIGFLIFGFLIYQCISKSRFLYINTIEEDKIISLILLISFCGLSLNWMQTDFFRQYGFWLCVVILIKILNNKNFKLKFS